VEGLGGGGQPFDRRNFSPICHHRQRHAGQRALALEMHSAGAALSVITSLLSAGEADMIAHRGGWCGHRAPIDASDRRPAAPRLRDRGQFKCAIGLSVATAVTAAAARGTAAVEVRKFRRAMPARVGNPDAFIGRVPLLAG